jgi:hypothetical protein
VLGGGERVTRTGRRELYELKRPELVGLSRAKIRSEVSEAILSGQVRLEDDGSIAMSSAAWANVAVAAVAKRSHGNGNGRQQGGNDFEKPWKIRNFRCRTFGNVFGEKPVFPANCRCHGCLRERGTLWGSLSILKVAASHSAAEDDRVSNSERTKEWMQVTLVAAAIGAMVRLSWWWMRAKPFARRQNGIAERPGTWESLWSWRSMGVGVRVAVDACPGRALPLPRLQPRDSGNGNGKTILASVRAKIPLPRGM